MLPDEVLRVIRSSPGELITARQWAALGFTRQAVSRLRSDGVLDHQLHGIDAEHGRPAPRDRGLQLPLLYLAARTPASAQPPLISGEAALAWAGSERVQMPPVPGVATYPSCRPRLAGLPFTVLPARDEGIRRVVIDGVDCADAGRVTADVADNTSLDDSTVRSVVDEVRRRWRVTAVELVARWRQIANRGARRLLAMAARGDFDCESEGERRAFDLLFRPFQPWPDCQVVYGRRRVDFVFIAAGLVIEYHGEVHDGFVDEDAQRVHELEELNLRVKVVTKSLLREPRPVGRAIHAMRVEREDLVRAGHLRLPPLGPQPPRLTPLRTLLPGG
jgi:hypothetical protein